MGFLNKLWCVTWNIGFVNKSVTDILSDESTEIQVHWVKHKYNDRFFADPFILSVNKDIIKVIVEEYFYNRKKGIITLLYVNAHNYEIEKRKVLLDCPWHQSYPFIARVDGKTFVIPEAANSGKAIAYKYNEIEECLEQYKTIINEPILDGTYLQIDNSWYLFATKLGLGKNRDLFIYKADDLFGKYTSTSQSGCVLSDLEGARPAGYVVKIRKNYYRVVQVCSKTYGEYIKVYKIINLDGSYKQIFVKDIRPKPSKFSYQFHTVNGLDGITVFDGASRTFRPFFRIKSFLQYKLGI